MPPQYLQEAHEIGDELQQSSSNPQRQVFRDEFDNPIWFFIHSSIKSTFVIQNLTDDIENHGGIVRDTDDFVDTVIVHRLYGGRDNLQLCYLVSPEESRRNTWVEPPSFVRHCINEGKVSHRRPQKEGMGGSMWGVRGRTKFTREDDENLVAYIARMIHEPDAGGRQGLVIYRELVEMANTDPQRYSWASRHTPHAWRERYKRHQRRFNALIDRFVKEHHITKSHYHRDRRISRKTQLAIDPDDDSEEGYNSDLQSPPVAKTRLLGDPHNVAILSHRSRKGKERARDMFEETTDGNLSSLFGSESEPDRAERPALQTNLRIHEDSHLPSRRSSLASPTNLRTSQVTLVASTQQHLPQNLGDSLKEYPPSATSGRALQPSPTPVAQGTDVQDSLPAYNILLANESPLPELPELLPTKRDRPSGTKKARLSRIKQTMHDTPQAPYLNTRSRSRSVEPSTLPSTRQTQRKRKGQEVSELQLLPPLEEHEEADYARGSTDLPVVSGLAKQAWLRHHTLQPIDSAKAYLVTETLEEESDVVDHLVNNISGGSNDIYAQQTQSSSPSDSSEGSLDSDDAQTDRNLRQSPAVSISQVQRPTSTFALHNLDPDQVLQMLSQSQPAASTPRYTRRSTLNLPGNQRESAASQGRLSAPGPSRRNAIDAAYNPPRTPKNLQNQYQSNSMSGDESFPLSGTKASALKMKIEEEEKRVPYSPPAGTRAARLKKGR
ncbi:hypothetical protein H0H81_009835 [Sphagnurus paluster]|uniref:Rap1 Myb domain-containing protein n=1 Tax=Sphagnurus paluster TaxID=117069 RepID=A0A9P7KIP1_9AGAR|nr:hypothetical protein H0H81_009835 [Sphagnurus paluster]